MSPEDLERIRDLIEAQRREIISEGDLKIEPTQQDAFERPDADDDQPLSEMVQVITSRRNQNRTILLRQLDAALQRIKLTPEDYGYCIECDEPIPIRRLELMPNTLLCVTCQSQREADPTRGGSRRKLTDYRCRSTSPAPINIRWTASVTLPPRLEHAPRVAAAHHTPPRISF